MPYCPVLFSETTAFTANTAWNDLDGWVSSGTYEGNVTKWSSAVSCSSNTTYNI